MTTDALIAAGWGWLGLALVLVATFAAGRAWKNYAIVDAVWALSFTPLVLWYALAAGPWQPQRLLLVAAVAAWSLRLGLHLANRIWRAHPAEDRRYAALRERWRPHADAWMFGFFQLQGIASIVLSLPLLLAAFDPDPVPGAWEWLGLALVAAGIAGEAAADAQLRRFKRSAPGPHAVCRTGLWRHSRHPNYFFEWLAWVGLAVFALGAPGGWLGLVAPAVMWLLLRHATGIPATEEAALTTKGDAYRDYQRTTNAFFPGPPRPAGAPQPAPGPATSPP